MVARHNFPAVVLGLLSVFALDVIALDSTEQIVFSAPAVSGEVPNASRGVLRSFSVAGEVEAGRMLSFAQTQRWDVWHVSPSRVDIYLPPHAPELSLDSFPPVLSFSDSPIAYTAPATSKASLSEPWDASTLTNATFYADYRPLDDIYSFMTQLANEHPDQISLVSLGHSGEGREMYALEISAPAAQSWSHEQKLRGRKREEGKAPPGFVITGAQHAREWVATSTALYVAHALVANGTEEYSLSPLLQHFSFYIVPVPNPDGYLYTWDHDRFWYKNRQELGHGAACTGLDMNRNWGYKWKATAGDELVRNKKKKPKRGAADPCSHWYPGSRPFQAPEVNNMANYFETLPRLRAFVDLRSYGQMLSTPYSYSCKKYPKDAEDQMEAISGAANAARRPHGTSFTTGQLCSTLYRAPGNVVDWMYSALGIKWSFAAHLRDTGTYGFNLPAEWIRPVAEETTQMVDYLARFIATKEKL